MISYTTSAILLMGIGAWRISDKIVGHNWLNSQEKREMDAFFATNLQKPALLLADQTLKLLAPWGYGVMLQSRLGKYRAPFSMLKLQTLSAVDLPHQSMVESPPELHPSVQFVRDIALDELIQIFHVSKDPDKPGPMSFLGARRPQITEELYLRERALINAGYKSLARDYMELHDSTDPAVFAHESLAKVRFDPGTVPYYKFCAESLLWYYEHASPAVDLRLFAGLILIGSQLLAPQEP